MRTAWLLSAACSIGILGSASAWAQSSMPATAPASMSSPSDSMGMKKPTMSMKHHKKGMMWSHGSSMGMKGPSDADHSADMLNGKELQSKTMPMAPAPMTPMTPANPS